MKVIHLQNSTESAGGVVPKLHNAFLEANIDSSILTLKLNVNDDDKVIQLGRIPKFKAKLNFRLQSFLSKKNSTQFGIYSDSILGSNVTKIKQVIEADVIYLHWVQGGFLNLQNIEQLAKLNKPVIFFMHDMWAITGGCHYSFTCEKYRTKCGDCQVLQKNQENDRSSKQFSRKLKLYSKYNNLYFVTPSTWLYNCVRQSALTINKPVFHIPNIVDTTIFKPFYKIAAKQILNIDTDDTVIAFGAVSIKSPYKGWTYLQRALQILKSDSELGKITVLLFGGDFNRHIVDDVPFTVKHVGFLRDEYSTALVYNAADVFIAPSLADNLPTTVLQSLFCGTPVVGFDIGGIPDMIMHKSNGYLAKYKDEADLAYGIRYCLSNKIKGKIPIDFEPGKIIEKHVNLINSLIYK